MAYIVTKKLIIDTQDKSIGVSDCMTKGNNGYFAVNYTTGTNKIGFKKSYFNQ
jgi:hypothetical protein